MTIKKHLHLLSALLLTCCLAAGLTACGSDDLSAVGYACGVDNTLVDEKGPCARDVDCPCGTHCAYGLCQYDCRERSDCDDGWCDALGQCRDKNDRAAT
ncbi:MAG: hypothetical protein JRH20_28015, partial [Deltaproteobacteria bacterium]|nr:hypothetical protein [Deltaproteobacteria bacterium]